MKKETKNIITRESCQNRLIESEKDTLRLDVWVLVIILLIFVPFICMGIYLSKTFLILGIILTVCFLAVPAIFVYNLMSTVKRLRLIKRGGFSIVKDSVLNLSKDEFVRGYRHPVDVIYFAKFGKCVPGTTVLFELSSPGDEFYLVVLHTKKKEPSLIYHTSMYDCKELD